MRNKIYAFLLSLLLLITVFPQSIFAGNITNPSINTSKNNGTQSIFPTVKNYNSKKNTSIHWVPFSISPRKDGTGVDVQVTNQNPQNSKEITVTITASGHKNSQSITQTLLPKKDTEFNFALPLTKCNTTYKATISFVENNRKKTFFGTATLKFTEKNLQVAKWEKGTFTTRGASLEYHFIKHGEEVNATNLVTYLNLAIDYRTQVINDIKKKNTRNYKITTGLGNIPSHKYKEQKGGRFIILSDDNYSIFSFGI